MQTHIALLQKKIAGALFEKFEQKLILLNNKTKHNYYQKIYIYHKKPLN